MTFPRYGFLVYFGKFLVMSSKMSLPVLVLIFFITANGFLFFIVTEFIKTARLENFPKTFIVTAFIEDRKALLILILLLYFDLLCETFILYEHVYSVPPYPYHTILQVFCPPFFDHHLSVMSDIFLLLCLLSLKKTLSKLG